MCHFMEQFQTDDILIKFFRCFDVFDLNANVLEFFTAIIISPFFIIFKIGKILPANMESYV